MCLVYTAYAAEQEEYGRIVSGMDDYTVPLMDMFFFAYDKAEEGYVDLDEEQTRRIWTTSMRSCPTPGPSCWENTTHRMLVSLDLPEEGEETFRLPPDHPPGGGAVL